MINPNNTRKLGEALSELLERIIPEEQLLKLSERQRNFLTTLIYLDETGQKTRDGKNPLSVIKEILEIRDYLNKKQVFIKTKFN